MIYTVITTLICLIGTALNVKKLKICFYFWAVGNMLWLIYDILSGLYTRAVLDVVQLIFSILGAVEWSKGEKE